MFPTSTVQNLKSRPTADECFENRAIVQGPQTQKLYFEEGEKITCRLDWC